MTASVPLIPGLIDVHAHLQDEAFAPDLEAVMTRAGQAGVAAIVVPGTDRRTSEAAMHLAERFPTVWATAGFHPHEARHWDPMTSEKWLRDLMLHPRMVAVGEIGLDYHYDFSPREMQRHVFKTQLDLAVDLCRPAVIHLREAFDDFLLLVRDRPLPPKMLLHCFSGTLDQARAALRLHSEVHFSIGGPLTFAKGDDCRAVFADLPRDRIHLETDCPYLSPHPRRGKRNEPAWLPLVAERMAEVTRTPIPDLVERLAENAEHLFSTVFPRRESSADSDAQGTPARGFGR
jgi:TatD DNase family protein